MQKRYIKQIKLEGFGEAAQQKLTRACILIVGAGGLGCPAITYLAAAGAGTLGIMDHDRVEETNLHRQPLYGMADIGEHKVAVAEKRARELNPEIQVKTWAEPLTEANARDIISAFDLVLDCTDNYEARYLINDICVWLGKPWVYGAVEAWTGQLAVFNYLKPSGEKTATYRCIFPQQGEEALNCNDMGVIGTLPGFVGTLQASEAIKIVTGAGEVLAGLLLADLQNNHFQTLKISRNQEEIDRFLARRFAKPAKPNDNEEITADAFSQNRGNYVVIDIRDEYEIDEEPFAMADFQLSVDALLRENQNFNKDKFYLLVCASGQRSKLISKKLKGLYPGVSFASLRGGIHSLPAFH